MNPAVVEPITTAPGIVREGYHGLEWQDPKTKKWHTAVYHKDIIPELIQQSDEQKRQFGDYRHPRAQGEDHNDQTTFVAGQQNWGFNPRNDRPDILFQIYQVVVVVRQRAPDEHWFHSGRLVIDHARRRPLIAWPEIPTVVSTKVEGWLVEAITRSNTRISLDNDILPRVFSFCNNSKLINGIQKRQAEFRSLNGLLPWAKRGNWKVVYQALENVVGPQVWKANTLKNFRILTQDEIVTFRKATFDRGRFEAKIAAENARNGADVVEPQGIIQPQSIVEPKTIVDHKKTGRAKTSQRRRKRTLEDDSDESFDDAVDAIVKMRRHKGAGPENSFGNAADAIATKRRRKAAPSAHSASVTTHSSATETISSGQRITEPLIAPRARAPARVQALIARHSQESQFGNSQSHHNNGVIHSADEVDDFPLPYPGGAFPVHQHQYTNDLRAYPFADPNQFGNQGQPYLRTDPTTGWADTRGFAANPPFLYHSPDQFPCAQGNDQGLNYDQGFGNALPVNYVAVDVNGLPLQNQHVYAPTAQPIDPNAEPIDPLLLENAPRAHRD